MCLSRLLPKTCIQTLPARGSLPAPVLPGRTEPILATHSGRGQPAAATRVLRPCRANIALECPSGGPSTLSRLLSPCRLLLIQELSGVLSGSLGDPASKHATWTYNGLHAEARIAIEESVVGVSAKRRSVCRSSGSAAVKKQTTPEGDYSSVIPALATCHPTKMKPPVPPPSKEE